MNISILEEIHYTVNRLADVQMAFCTHAHSLCPLIPSPDLTIVSETWRHSLSEPREACVGPGPLNSARVGKAGAT